MTRQCDNSCDATWWPTLEPMQVVPQFTTDASGATWRLNVQLVQVAPSGGQVWNNASSAIWWWLYLYFVQVAPPGNQIWNQCKWRHLAAKLATNVSRATWWPDLQMAPSKKYQKSPCAAKQLKHWAQGIKSVT